MPHINHTAGPLMVLPLFLVVSVIKNLSCSSSLHSLPPTPPLHDCTNWRNQCEFTGFYRHSVCFVMSKCYKIFWTVEMLQLQAAARHHLLQCLTSTPPSPFSLLSSLKQLYWTAPDVVYGSFLL